MHQNSIALKASLENSKITAHKYRLLIMKITVFAADIGYFVKLLSNH